MKKILAIALLCSASAFGVPNKTIVPLVDDLGVWLTNINFNASNSVTMAEFATSGTVWQAAIDGKLGTNNADFVTSGGTSLTNTAAQIIDSRNYKMDESRLTVLRGTNDVSSFASLTNTYEQAKLLTPNGNALASDNRATVFIPPGGYDSGTNTFMIDTDYIDLIAMSPEMGMPNLTDGTYDDDPANYNPPKTVIYNNEGYITADQSANDVRLIGFGICQKSSTAVQYRLREGGTQQNNAAFWVTASNSPASYYEKMYFWNGATNINPHYARATWHDHHVDGTWRDCVANRCGWMVFDDSTGTPHYFRAKMYGCYGGIWSFGGDYSGGGRVGGFVGAELYDCHAVGNNRTYNSSDGGRSADYAFSGCGGISISADSDTIFYNCSAGINSFVVGNTNAASMYYCRAGNGSAGSTVALSIKGYFTGYAEGCTFGHGSLGGSKNEGTSIEYSGHLSGTVVNCNVTGGVAPTRLAGATIRRSTFTMSTAGVDAFEILDSNSEIRNSIVVVNGSSTGLVVSATNAQSIVFSQVSINNTDNDADGLGSNVTNTDGSDPRYATAAQGALADTSVQSNQTAIVSGIQIPTLTGTIQFTGGGATISDVFGQLTFSGNAPYIGSCTVGTQSINRNDGDARWLQKTSGITTNLSGLVIVNGQVTGTY